MSECLPLWIGAENPGRWIGAVAPSGHMQVIDTELACMRDGVDGWWIGPAMMVEVSDRRHKGTTTAAGLRPCGRIERVGCQPRKQRRTVIVLCPDSVVV